MIGVSSAYMIESRGLRPTSISHGYAGTHSPLENGLQKDAPQTPVLISPEHARVPGCLARIVMSKG